MFTGTMGSIKHKNHVTEFNYPNEILEFFFFNKIPCNASVNTSLFSFSIVICIKAAVLSSLNIYIIASALGSDILPFKSLKALRNTIAFNMYSSVFVNEA